MLRPCALRSARASIRSHRFSNVILDSPITSSAYVRTNCRGLQTEAHTTGGPASNPRDYVPLRKQLKDEAKAKKGKKKHGKNDAAHEKWELTVGIEIHAQLNTDCKLFSKAATSINEAPNSHVALFDIATPGSQPEFQRATLIPALRAALALNCDVQRVSRFDRKHYFYQDQPAGYQITQYYEPFAKDGSITLFNHDGIDPRDGESITIGIKQIQMEQDTAKSQEHTPGTHLLDFNRVSHPLIEIITLPQIHYPATAAACVRKIQAILQSVGAVTTGMEMGGLRADVNVSIREHNPTAQSLSSTSHQYSGVTGLGQRTEIKNLSSFKAVEDAIIAERDRQVSVVESGGAIEGETRGWTIGSNQTRRLRGKEGEVDYRYMPDPDLGPVLISEDVLRQLGSNLPLVPDQLLAMLTEDGDFALTVKDAKPLIDQDDGSRLEYYFETVEALGKLQGSSSAEIASATSGSKPSHLGRTAANFLLHELGGQLTTTSTPWTSNPISASTLAEIIHLQLSSEITPLTAKALIGMYFANISSPDSRSVSQIIDEDNLRLVPLSDSEYAALAQKAMAMNEKLLEQIRTAGSDSRAAKGKLGWFVGQMVRAGEEGRVEAGRAEEALKRLVFGS